MPTDHLKLLRAADLAALLTVSAGTLAKWRLAGTGPAYKKLGSRIAYDPRDLAAWLDARKRRSTSDPGATP